MVIEKKFYKNNLQKYRVWRGVLQTDLAKATGIYLAKVRLIESNKISPNLKTMEIICEYFDVSFDQMFYLED